MCVNSKGMKGTKKASQFREIVQIRHFDDFCDAPFPHIEAPRFCTFFGTEISSVVEKIHFGLLKTMAAFVWP